MTGREAREQKDFTNRLYDTIAANGGTDFYPEDPWIVSLLHDITLRELDGETTVHSSYSVYFDIK